MLNWVVRYAPVVRFLKKIGTEDVLEVGSGSWGLAEFVDFVVTGCDVEFSAERSERLRSVVGSAIDLPFADGQFECVVCLDTLEHIPPGGRERAIKELARVTSRYLVIGCPAGGTAQTIDRLLYKNFRFHPNGPPIWLREHMQFRFPRKQDIARVLDEESFKYRVLMSENGWMHYLLMCGEALPGIVMVLNRLSRIQAVRRYMPSTTIRPAYRTIFFAERVRPN